MAGSLDPMNILTQFSQYFLMEIHFSGLFDTLHSVQSEQSLQQVVFNFDCTISIGWEQ